MPEFTPLKISYPTPDDLHPSANWWKALAVSADNAMTALFNKAKDEASWIKPPLTSGSDLDSLVDPGLYPMLGGQTAASIGIPVPNVTPGWLEVMHGYNSIHIVQRFKSVGGGNDMRRFMWNGVWRAWEQLSAETSPAWLKSPPLSGSSDLNSLVEPGVYPMLGAQTPANIGIPVPATTPGWLEVMHGYNSKYIVQRFRSVGGGNDMRRFMWDGVWRSWETDGAAAPLPAGGGGTGLQARLTPEITGEWATREQWAEYLEAFSTHLEVELLTIGTSVRGRDIPAIRIGDPTKPAFLAVGGQHPNEPSNPHGTLVWARQLLEADTTILMDMCILIVPCLNMDGWLAQRNNGNNVDINRDWLDFSQPETIALRDFVAQHNVVGAVDGHSFGYPRQVSLKIPSEGSVDVLEKSQGLYDAVWAEMEKRGHEVREYGPPAPITTLRDGLARMGVPAILLEVPSRSEGTPIADRPNAGWQLKVSAQCMDAAAHKAWEWVKATPPTA